MVMRSCGRGHYTQRLFSFDIDMLCYLKYLFNIFMSLYYKRSYKELCPNPYTFDSDNIVNVTGFAKKGLIHASNFVTLRMCNSAHV